MKLVRPCGNCHGPVAIKMSVCPHCGGTQALGITTRVVSTVMTFVGGVSITSTLAACYGAPCAADGCGPDYVPTCDEVSSTPESDDTDGDGYCLSYDCDENDAEINDAAYDTPNDGIDQDCDGDDASE